MQSRDKTGSDIAVGLLSAGALTLVGFLAGKTGGRREEDWPAESNRKPASSWEGEPSTKQSTDRKAHADEALTARGRSATKPTAIPAQGWKDILWRVYEEFSHDRLMLVAAGVTFYVLLALFPAITAFVSIYGLFNDPASVGDQLNTMQGVLPSGALQIIGEQLTRLSSQEAQKLGFGMIFGLGVALWSANAGMKTLFDAMNIVYEEEEKRGFVWLTLVTLGFTLATIFALILALASVVVLPVVLNFLHLGGLETVLLLLRWPVLLVLVAFGLSVIYRFGPSRRKAKWRWIAPGSLVAAALWVVFSILFSWYAQNFGSYDETYGSLGAAIGFMTWIWISTIVVLLGAELNAEMEHQTAIDSTDASPRPMGARGATMADTVGEAK